MLILILFLRQQRMPWFELKDSVKFVYQINKYINESAEQSKVWFLLTPNRMSVSELLPHSPKRLFHTVEITCKHTCFLLELVFVLMCSAGW